MIRKKYSGILLSLLFIMAACRTQKTEPRPVSPEAATFPSANIPLPSTDFNFILPAPPELAKHHAPKKEITETFSQRDQSVIAVQDPKLFSDTNSEIIDLSMIDEGEYAFPVILACVSGNLMPLMCQTNSLDTFCKCPYKSMK